METELFKKFIEEALARLPVIRSGILVYRQDGGPSGGLEMPIRSIQSIRDSASALGAKEIESAATFIENELSAIKQLIEPSSDDRLHAVLDSLAQFEAMLIDIDPSDEFSLNIPEFVDDAFDVLQNNSKPDNPETSEEELEGFEIDEELLAIFAEEAEGLLRNIENSLAVLAKNPGDNEALWEIRRNAHTFKGAAGIVGLKYPSELAHRVEDLIDRIAEADKGSNEKIFELLLTATDCLKALTNGENSPQLTARISTLYYNFDGILVSLTGTEGIIDTPPQTAQVYKAEEAIPQPVAETTEEKPESKAQPNRSIVRVQLARLDDLVRIVRDLIVSRSVFEQRLEDFDRQLDELHNTTRRLQITSGKLETDFEASMLGNGFTLSPASPFQRPARGSASGFDDLEFDQYTEFHQSTRELTETTSDAFAINSALETLHGSFESIFDQQRRLVEEMQEKLMRIRMVEFGSLSTRLQRAVRVTCDEEGKKAEISIENEKLEIDTQIVDALIEPLMHLLKNAVVHGIETADTRRLLGKPEAGRINLTLVHEETHIVLTVSDDGRGIGASAIKEKAVSMGLIDTEKANSLTDEETLNLIFLPGLTTAEKLNMSAGRGVGMNIVKQSIESQKGTISIASTPQQGTTFTIRMPLALAVTNVLLIKVNRQTYALPLKQIKYVGEVSQADVKNNGNEETIELGNMNYTLTYLRDYLGMPNGSNSTSDRLNTVIIELADKTVALAIDGIVKSEEVVIKSLGKPLESIKGLIGATILGNGELVAILDLPALLKSRRPIPAEQILELPADEITIMVVDDSPSVRHLTSKVITGVGWQVVTAKDGVDALEQLNAARKLPDVVLTDIEMPRMDGYELAASLKRQEQFREIPVIVITSRTGEKHREKALENGVSEYLTKPFEDKELIGKIEGLLEK